jgi:hypothetical protein
MDWTTLYGKMVESQCRCSWQQAASAFYRTEFWGWLRRRECERSFAWAESRFLCQQRRARSFYSVK